MKKKLLLIPLFILSIAITVSCGSKKYKTYDKDLSIVTLNGYVEDSDNVTDIKDITAEGTLKLKFIEGEDYIPYIDALSYITFIPEKIQKNTKYIDDENEVDFIFEFGDKKASVRIFTKEEKVYFENQLSYIYDADNDEDTSASLRTILGGTLDNSKMVDHVIDYKQYGFKTFREDGKTYLPLAFIDPLVTASHNSSVFYNYEKLFMFTDPNALSGFTYKVNGKETNAMEEMKAKTEKVMPDYLRKFNKNYLYFMFDSFYGLKEQKGITKMSTYFESFEYSKELLSEDPEVRANALELLIATLDDSHTTPTSSSTAWDERDDKELPQSLKKDRNVLDKALKAKRASVYNELNLDEAGVRYSKDGKTAVITLDAFEVDNFIYDKNKKVKSDIELAESDHFFKILNNLKEIDKKTGVSYVVIDMSINSGGNSGTMAKILNLMSKQNSMTLTFRDSNTNAIQTLTTKIDSNNDGKYDEKDVYGNKYKFFILTSPVAFSCGTAMPFYASHQGLGYIIGQTQGGGECALGQFVLPNGQVIAFSSPFHISETVEGNLVGDEAGVAADIALSYFDFYDIDKIGEKIKSYLAFIKE